MTDGETGDVVEGAARKLRLLVAYDGTDFVGWQMQNEGRSVQGDLVKSFADMLGKPVQVVGAARTDAGVHALGQVAMAIVDVDIPTLGFLRGLNKNLAHDIAVLEVTDVAPDFNPRFDARAKIYRYSVYNHPVRSPQHRRTTWHVRRPLDVHAMREAAAMVVGEHDFRGFRAAACTRKTTRRLIHRVDVYKQGPHIHIEVEGTAFLMNMVRIIAGTLVGVGQGERTLDQVREMLEDGDRKLGGITAPAAGLTLMSVLF